MLWNRTMGAVQSRYGHTGETLRFDLSNTGLQMFRREIDLVCFPTRLQMGQRITIKGIPSCIQHKLRIGSVIKGIYLEDMEGESDLLYLSESKYNGRVVDFDDFCSCDRSRCESPNWIHDVLNGMVVVVGDILPEDDVLSLTEELPFLVDPEYPISAEFIPLSERD